MPTALDQPAEAAATAHVGWVNPPAAVTDAISALQHHCEAWPKTPISNPLNVVSGAEDAICQAVTGHAIFVPIDLGMTIMQIGTFMISAFIFALIAILGFVWAASRLWSHFFAPPRPPKPAPPPIDTLTAIVVVIGWLGWISATTIATRYGSVGLGQVFLAATLMWTFIARYLVVLLRSKST